MVAKTVVKKGSGRDWMGCAGFREVWRWHGLGGWGGFDGIWRNCSWCRGPGKGVMPRLLLSALISQHKTPQSERLQAEFTHAKPHQSSISHTLNIVISSHYQIRYAMPTPCRLNAFFVPSNQEAILLGLVGRCNHAPSPFEQTKTPVVVMKFVAVYCWWWTQQVGRGYCAPSRVRGNIEGLHAEIYDVC